MHDDNPDLRPTGAETPNDSPHPEVPMVPMSTDAFPPPSQPCETKPKAKPGPKLVFWPGNNVVTVNAVSDLLSKVPNLFERGGPVRIVADGATLRIEPLTSEAVVILTSKCADVFRASMKNGDIVEVPASIPLMVARLYGHLASERGLRRLNGITSSPILHLDGSFNSVEGYDPVSGLWVCNVPTLNVPENPSLQLAKAALARLRERFSTFPFADAAMKHDPGLGILRVRQDLPPGLDESSYLTGLLTAVARPSLPLAPGMVIRAPMQSGSGSGKGLLVKCAAIIATGAHPDAITAGHDSGELDKRLNTALIQGAPFIFLDNVNSTGLRSDTLASAVTEPNVQLRALGSSTPIPAVCRSFIAITGNGMHVSEDLVSRFLDVELDARTDDPETRRMPAGFIDGVKQDRAALLGDILTIIRYGIQNPYPGLPLRNFDEWAKLCRDSLLGLGATDPVARLQAVKANDPMREHHTAIMNAWQKAHGSTPVAVTALQKSVVELIAQGANRQALAAKVKSLVGMRIGNRQLVVARTATENSPTLYKVAVEQT